MFSSWHVTCSAKFLDDCDKVRLAETSRALLIFVRTHCTLDFRLYDTSKEETQRLFRAGWNLANLVGCLEHCENMSDAQRSAVRLFHSDQHAVSDLRFRQFPNLIELDATAEDKSDNVDLSRLKRLEAVRMVCGDEVLQKMDLPESLTYLWVMNAVPRTESLTLEELDIVGVDLENAIPRDSQFSFPTLRSVYLYSVSGAEHVLSCLPETIEYIWFKEVTLANFEGFLRFRRLRELDLETELFDESLAQTIEQLPETLECIALANTTQRRCNGLNFAALKMMKNLYSVELMGVGGVLDMNNLRQSNHLEQIKLLDMDVVKNVPENQEAIWPQLKIFTVRLLRE